MISIESTSNDISLECDDFAVWSIAVKGQNFGLSLEDYRVLLSLLPFLELGREKILTEVKDKNARKSFPELVLIEAGLKNGSEHWSNCALNWLESNEIETIKKFELYLESILENKKKYSQILRQRAKALLKIIYLS